jgi:hypothetical protein
MWRSRRSPSGGNRNAEAIDTLAGWPPGATRLLTKSEQEAYDLLRTALPTNMVLAQVPLHRFIKVPARNSYSEWMRRVGRQHVDLVVCDRHSQVLAAVEVVTEDPAPGSRAERRRNRMMRVLAAARIPVHVWRASALPSTDEAREAILPGSSPSDFQPTSGHVQARGVVMPMPALAGLDMEELGDEPAGLREPPPSTWFDDIDSVSTPIATGLRRSADSRAGVSR